VISFLFLRIVGESLASRDHACYSQHKLCLAASESCFVGFSMCSEKHPFSRRIPPCEKVRRGLYSPGRIVSLGAPENRARECFTKKHAQFTDRVIRNKNLAYDDSDSHQTR
jgi:hypothetical protein